ncbi:MAG: YgjV family protein [Lachnospiraceae bacterium]|nr:YgjV family protein [Lachnospiraceae bacterium]
MNSMIVEGIGYVGSALVVVSMLMTSVKKLRIINSIGSAIFAFYALLIHSYPTAIMNIFLLIINIHNIIRLKQNEKNYNVIECYKDESIVQLYLGANLEDIRRFFPDFELGGGHLKTYLICTGSQPVGIMTGDEQSEERYDIELDYTTPMYRDLSVGNFLFEHLDKNKGYKVMSFSRASNDHEKYLLHMNFHKTEEGYIRERVSP